MSKIKVEIELKTNVDLHRVSIDETEIYFNNGKCCVELELGTCYSLTWFVLGEEGSSYVLKITKPKQIKLNVSRVLDYSKKDAGQFWIELSKAQN